MADDQQYTGGFLGLVPDNAGQLAVDGGDPPEQMHLTLLYLGDDVASLDPAQLDQLRELVTASAPALDPVDARIIGHAVLNPDGSGDRKPCAVYLVGDSTGLDPLRQWAQWVTTAHDDYPTPPEQHSPVLYHVTAGYGLKPDQLTYAGPVRFATLRLALAGDVLDVPLGDAEAPVIAETKSGEITFTPPAEIMEVAAILPGPVARLVAEGKALNARGVDWVEANCGQIGGVWAADMRARAGEVETKRAKPDMNMGRRVDADGDTDDDPALQSIDDLHGAIGAHHQLPPEKRKTNIRRLKGAAKRLGADHHTTQRIGSLEQANTEGKSLDEDVEVKIASPDPKAQKLRDYWAYGKGRKKWRPGSKGDFKRLRRHLAKYVHNPRVLNGLTANIHKMATGEWPGPKAHTAAGNVGRALKVGGKALAWPEDAEIKAAAMLVNDTDADMAALHAGVDDWGNDFVEDWVDGYLAALEDEMDADGDAGTDSGPDEHADLMADTARLASLGSRLVPDPGPDADTGATEGGGAAPPADGDGDVSNLFDLEPVSA